MAKRLVIVESPTKARTISRFLGNDFIVESSYGHVRDLPKSKLGVDVENNFAPQYVIPTKARKHVNLLKKVADTADEIILATDEDREGEAIAWHLVTALGLEDRPGDHIRRIVFHEITKTAIDEALKNPRDIDIKRVNAQQARRVLDRLVGYSLSPFLWKKVIRGLSAGRVQSVAVRLIVEREREIQSFRPQEYWTVTAALQKEKDKARKAQSFEAALIKIGDTKLEKFSLADEAAAKAVTDDLENATWQVDSIEKRAVSKKPSPPFTTSTLQQEAFRRLGFSARQTMRTAQQLYEGVELGDEGPTGLITYMRTDSVNLSEESLRAANQFIKKDFGNKYVLSSPRRFKTKSKGAQEAHEAIRPTDPARTPDAVKPHLDRNQFRLYDLIWRRFVATQMAEALFDATAVDIGAKSQKLKAKSYLFRATGQTMKFDGYLAVWPAKFEEMLLPELSKDDTLTLNELKPLQHFTEPPPRFSEASLIKALEQNGIGRPSTYAPTLATIQDRGYVEKDESKRLRPTEVGSIVNDLLVEHFPEIVDIQFTAKMEEELDEIAEGKREWQPVIREFYEPFSKNLAEKYEVVEKQTPVETTEEVCEKCGKPMVIKFGRFGKFLACSGFPECKNAKPLPKEPPKSTGVPCPECKEGEIVERFTRKGRRFFGCSRYPDCKHAMWTDPRNNKQTAQN
ncbi:MAG: type I DNA topoisomerase [Candidatus Sungbacteria bacterium]|uniref:DNA topoisomerase 1 n=1 Tax=Candidatus Sungiibacteriota bacterium TaxID=2750080 RepID=A0A932YVG0_9BACT|nr:type I DNA topoisomerase [Candidatus Sungbacteria bacterium]